MRRLASIHGMSWSTWKSRHAWAPRRSGSTQFVYQPTLPPSGMTVMIGRPLVMRFDGTAAGRPLRASCRRRRRGAGTAPG